MEVYRQRQRQHTALSKMLEDLVQADMPEPYRLKKQKRKRKQKRKIAAQSRARNRK